MKKRFLILTILLGIGVVPVFSQNYDNWAIGVKVGEPIGLNVRKYFDSGTKNFDVNVGTYGLLWGGTRKYAGNPYYVGTAGFMLQGIFHWNKQLGSSERFQVYYGFGGQLNSRKTARVVGNNSSIRERTIGGVGNAGIEYSLPDNDLSLFVDGGVYVELIGKPLFMAVPASVGLRLNLSK